MSQKRGILFILSIIFLFLSISYTYAEDLDPNTEGCCISPNGCEFITRESCENIGNYRDFNPDMACSVIESTFCDIGCCCDTGEIGIQRIQCVGDFYEGLTQDACTAQCGTLEIPDVEIIVEEEQIQNVTQEEEEEEEPEPLVDVFCGNGLLEINEVCDGDIDTILEGTRVDCEGQCGLTSPCRCPITCSQSPDSAIFRSVQPLKFEKGIELSWDLISSNCYPNDLFIERCEGQDLDSCDWIPIVSGLREYTFIDTNFEFDTYYNYRIGTYYYDDTNYAVTTYSNILSVDPISEFCLNLHTDIVTANDQFCVDGWVSYCNVFNQIISNYNCEISPNSICSAGSCVQKSVCGECSTPFGIFFLPQCSLPACYLDYSRFNVDTYQGCENIDSCYDYRSEDACEANACGIPECEWGESDFDELGIGVCKPESEAYQDCDKCGNLNNPLILDCDANICSLVGDTCTYTSTGACIGETDMGCVYYDNEEDCIGESEGVELNIVKDDFGNRIDGDNKILIESDDLYSLGKCIWTDRCIKDSDYNGLKDCKENDYLCQIDNVPPETTILNVPVVPQKIELSFSTFDNTPDSEIKTWYSIEKEWTYPKKEVNKEINGNKIIETVYDSDFYVLTYYSMDESKNLEQVKSMRFYVDGEKPEVDVTYSFTPEELEEDEWVSKVDVTVSVKDNADKFVTCTGDLVQGTNTYYAMDVLYKELIADWTVHYSNIHDGFYTYNYECIDRSGNVRQGSVPITISADSSIRDPKPSETQSRHQNIPISVITAKKSECKYSQDANNFDYMENTFSTSDGIYHSSTVDVSPLISHHHFYVKCKILENDVIIGGPNDDIKFTVDEKAPETKINNYLQTCAANWLHTDFALSFDCQDPAQRKEGYPTEFGCANTFYCLGDTCNPSQVRGTVTLSSTTPITYYSVDKGNNIESYKRDIIRIDTQEPVVFVSIIDTVTNNVVNTINRVTQEPYVIQITSTKPIERFNGFGFALSNEEYYELPTPYPQSLDKKVWRTLFNPSEFKNLNKRAEFQINALAEHGWFIDTLIEETFYINTMSDEDSLSITSSGNINLNEVKVNNLTINPSTKDGKEAYYLQEDQVTIKGTVDGLESLYYYLGTEKVGLSLYQNNFEFDLKLFNVNGAEVETVLYFIGEDANGNILSKSFSFVIDKQGPYPTDYELENADGVMIKTPLPTLIVSFDEPVTLVDYGLQNYDIDISVVNINNKEFKFTINEPLSNGCYKFYVLTNDSLGNEPLSPYEIGFGIDASETRIILENPHHGVSQTKEFDMVVKTTWAANCKYSLTEPDNFDFPLLLNFDTTGLLEHKKDGFSISTDQPFYVICDDGRQEIKQSFILKVDTTAPVIERAEAVPPVVSQQGISSQLIVETDEANTICKYSLSTSNFDEMRFFPGETLDNPNTYKKIHYKILPFDGTPRTEVYNVQCEDISGRRSSLKTVTFKVEEQALQIDVQSPPKYTSERFIDLNFTTNEIANCKYKNVSGDWIIISEETREHDYPLGRFEKGVHTIDLECTTITGLSGALSKPEIAELTYTFTIDLTKPVMQSVSGGNYSCPRGDEYDIGISFGAHDNESGISLYKFDLVSEDGIDILSNQTSSSNQESISASLIEGEKYKVIASAINGAGLESTTKTSEPFLAKASTDIECREKNAPSLSFKVVESARGVNVVIDCDDESGCDADSIKYGLATDTNCAPVNPYDVQVELTESSFFCSSACDSLGNCGTHLQKIDVLGGDSDIDGVLDMFDECPNTPEGEIVDEQGCSESQRYIDTDSDGVRDQFDLCANTPIGQPVGNDGCPIVVSSYNEFTEQQIIEEETSIFSWLLMIFGVIVLLGGGGYFVYMQYFVPKSSTSKPIFPESFTQPIKRVFIPPSRRLNLKVRKGEDVFKSLDSLTSSHLFEKLSKLVKKEEKNIFDTLEQAVKLRHTKSAKKDDVFDQLTKATSLRKVIKEEHPLKDLKKLVKKSKSKTKSKRKRKK